MVDNYTQALIDEAVLEVLPANLSRTNLFLYGVGIETLMKILIVSILAFFSVLATHGQTSFRDSIPSPPVQHI
jgi:hypothetical protein